MQNKFLRGLFERIKEITLRKNEKKQEEAKENWDHNPYLFCFRAVIEQVLAAKEISYREFAPVLVDEEKKGMFVMEEDIFTVLHQIEKDLNALTIITDRPEVFAEYVQRLEEENGLLVDVRQKQNMNFRQFESLHGNVILDFEQEGHFCTIEKKAENCYLPIYKPPWKRGENLDIIVPIGYNTVIVKGITSKEETTDFMES